MGTVHRRARTVRRGRRARRGGGGPPDHVLRIVDGRIAEITTFGTQLFPVFGLPPVL
jgi:hypothetical protein